MSRQMKKLISSWDDVFGLGIELGLSGTELQRIQNDNPSILLGAYQVAFHFYSEAEGTREEKLSKFYEGFQNIGKMQVQPFVPKENMEDRASNHIENCNWTLRPKAADAD